MAFNFRSRFLTENIFHQFESIFQDIDEFVNKETMNFGKSVKRLYSNAVQDIHAVSGDAAKPEQQLVTDEHVDTETCVSATFIKTASSSSDEWEKNQISDIHEWLISKNADISEAQTCQNSREQGNATVQNSEESNNAEKDITEDLEPVTAKSRFDGDFCDGDVSSSPAFSVQEEGSRDEVFPDSDEDVSSSPAFSSAQYEESTSFEKEKKDFDYQNGDEGFSESDKAVYSLDIVDLSTSAQSSEPMFSSNSCKEKEEQMDITSWPSCTSLKSSITMETASADFSKESENVICSRFASDGCTYNISAASSIIAAASSISDADKSKKADVDPAFLIMESDDKNALQTELPESVIGSFEKGHEAYDKNAQAQFVISPSGTANIHGLDGNRDMVTIDLSSNVKHDPRSVVLYGNCVVPGSYRRKDFSYYKKLIQGGFTSRKRVSKEYEHLAIMYGDIDMDVKKAQSSQEINEDEWELL